MVIVCAHLAPYTSCTTDPSKIVEVLRVYTPEYVEVPHSQPGYRNKKVPFRPQKVVMYSVP